MYTDRDYNLINDMITASSSYFAKAMITHDSDHYNNS